MPDMTEELDDIELYEHLRMEVDRGQEPIRIDKYMSEHVQHSSRNRQVSYKSTALLSRATTKCVQAM